MGFFLRLLVASSLLLALALAFFLRLRLIYSSVRLQRMPQRTLSYLRPLLPLFRPEHQSKDHLMGQKTYEFDSSSRRQRRRKDRLSSTGQST